MSQNPLRDIGNGWIRDVIRPYHLEMGGGGVRRGCTDESLIKTSSPLSPLSPYALTHSRAVQGRQVLSCSSKSSFPPVILLRPAVDCFARTPHTPWKASLSPRGLHKTPLLFASTCDFGLRTGLVLLLLPPLLRHEHEEHSRPHRFLLRPRRGKDVCTKALFLVRCCSVASQAVGVPPSPLARSRCSSSIWSGPRWPSTLRPSRIPSVRWRGKSRGQKVLFVSRWRTLERGVAGEVPVVDRRCLEIWEGG